MGRKLLLRRSWEASSSHQVLSPLDFCYRAAGLPQGCFCLFLRLLGFVLEKADKCLTFSTLRPGAFFISLRQTKSPGSEGPHPVPQAVLLQSHKPLCVTCGLQSWISCPGPCAPPSLSPLSVAGLRTTATLSRAAQRLRSIRLPPKPPVSAQHFVSHLLGRDFLRPLDTEPKQEDWWR